MKICGTSLIPIFVTIIFCGVIFVYFNTRFNEVKNAVDKQNRVLTAFISNVQNDIKSGGMLFGANAMGFQIPETQGHANATHLASEEAVHTVKLMDERIVVSDDDSDGDSDTDSDTDSYDDSNTSSDDDDDNDKITPEVKIINLHDTNNGLPDIEVVSLPETAHSPDDDSLNLISDNLVLEHLPELTLKADDLNSASDSTKTEVNYDQMKVDDLRKIAVDLNLAGKEEVKKFKKPELLVLLKKPAN